MDYEEIISEVEPKPQSYTKPLPECVYWILALAFITLWMYFSSVAEAGLPPTTLKGQSETTAPTNFFFQTPYNQATTTSSVTRLIESDFGQLLLNGGYEHQAFGTSWSAIAGTSVAVETTNIHGGLKSANATLTTVSGTSFFQNVTPTIQLQGSNMEHSAWLKTATSNIQVCATNAGSVTGTCLNVIADNIWHQYVINLPGPSSGSVGILIQTSTSTSGSYYIDDAYVGKARNIGTVQQAYYFGGMEQAGIAGGTCLWNETSSTSLTNFVALGTSTGCSAWTVEGGVTATGTNDHRPVINNGAAGMYVVKFLGNVNDLTIGQTCIWRLSDGTTTYQPQNVFGGASTLGSPALEWHLNYATAPGTKTLQVQAADDGVGGCGLYNSAAGLNAAWKIYYYPSTAQTVANINNTPWYVDATMDGANPSLGTAAVTSYTEIADASLTLKPQSGSQPVGVMCSGTNPATAPSTGNTTCSVGNESVAINFSIPKAGTYEVCVYTSWTGIVNNGTVTPTFQLIETPTNAQTLTLEGGTRQQMGVQNSGVSDEASPISNCSYFNWTSSGTKGVRLMYEQAIASTVTSSLILADAGANNGQRNIRWTVSPVTQQLPMPLLVGSVTSNSSGAERIERATVLCSASSSVTTQSGSWLSSIGNISTGTCAITIAAGIFSASPSCTISKNQHDAGAISGLEALVNSATSVSANCQFLSSGSSTISNCSSQSMNIICQGPR